MIFRSIKDLDKIKEYRCRTKASFANKRFDDSICKEDILDVLKKYNFSCFYCMDKIVPTKWQLDHFYPRAMGGKNTIDNLVPCCRWCNTMKNALDGHSFINKCKQIIDNNFLSRHLLEYNITNKIYRSRAKKHIKKLKAKGIDINDDMELIIYEIVNKITHL